MVDKEIIRTFKKPLIWVSIISIVVIVIMGINIFDLNSRIDSCYERQNEMYEEYDYKCEDGYERICIESGKSYQTYDYDLGEYAVVIGEDETYAVCDTDRKERAICVDEDTYWNPCADGERQYCASETEDVAVCQIGNEALCVKEDRAGRISDTGYFNVCQIGESATCIDWDTEYITQY